MTSPTPTPQDRSGSFVKQPRDSGTATSSYYPSSRRSLGISISALLVNDGGGADREMQQEDGPLDTPGTSQGNSTK